MLNNIEFLIGQLSTNAYYNASIDKTTIKRMLISAFPSPLNNRVT